MDHSKHKKKERRQDEGADLPIEVLEFLGTMAMGGAVEDDMSPAGVQVSRERFDSQFAGTGAALAVGKAGPLRPTGNPRADVPGGASGRTGGVSMGKALPKLTERQRNRMTTDDVALLVQWLESQPDVDVAVEGFKADKGWHRNE